MEMSSSEVPYKIRVSDESINLLKKKLELVSFPDELEDAGCEYGVPLADMKRLVAHWKDVYDWRIHEAELNELPQFKRTINVEGFGDLDIHYVHGKSSVEAAIPLLFVHGCAYATMPYNPSSKTELQGREVSWKLGRSCHC